MPRIETRAGWSPLRWAIWQNDRTLLKLLLDHGATIESEDWNTAAWYSQEDIVALLLERGDRTGMPTEVDATPLHSAVAVNNIDVVALPLKNGVDINVKDKAGRTPLHKVIDLLIPSVRGGTIRLISGWGLGKMVLLSELIRNLATIRGGHAVIVGVEERPREWTDIRLEFQAGGIADKIASILVQIDDPPETHRQAMLTGLTIAEYFRDECGEDRLYSLVPAIGLFTLDLLAPAHKSRRVHLRRPTILA